MGESERRRVLDDRDSGALSRTTSALRSALSVTRRTRFGANDSKVSRTRRGGIAARVRRERSVASRAARPAKSPVSASERASRSPSVSPSVRWSIRSRRRNETRMRCAPLERSMSRSKKMGRSCRSPAPRTTDSPSSRPSASTRSAYVAKWPSHSTRWRMCSSSRASSSADSVRHTSMRSGLALQERRRLDLPGSE